MAHTFNPSTQEVEAGILWVWGQPGLLSELHGSWDYHTEKKNKQTNKHKRNTKNLLNLRVHSLFTYTHVIPVHGRLKQEYPKPSGPTYANTPLRKEQRKEKRKDQQSHFAIYCSHSLAAWLKTFKNKALEPYYLISYCTLTSTVLTLGKPVNFSFLLLNRNKIALTSESTWKREYVCV